MAVHLLSAVHRQALHHIAHDTIARQQFVVAEQFDVRRSHDTVVRSDIVTRQTGQGCLFRRLVAAHHRVGYLPRLCPAQSSRYGKSTISIQRAVHTRPCRRQIAHVQAALPALNQSAVTQQQIDTGHLPQLVLLRDLHQPHQRLLQSLHRLVPTEALQSLKGIEVRVVSRNERIQQAHQPSLIETVGSHPAHLHKAIAVKLFF